MTSTATRAANKTAADAAAAKLAAAPETDTGSAPLGTWAEQTDAGHKAAEHAAPASGADNKPAADAKPAAKPGAHPKMKMSERLPLLVKWALKQKAGFTLAQAAAANDISLGVAKYSCRTRGSPRSSRRRACAG